MQCPHDLASENCFIGPLQFDGTAFTGGLPKLQLYPHTWTKVQNFKV